jgi:signal transduction histidine kinase
MIAAVDPVLFHAADENTSTPKGSCLGAPLFVKDEVLGVLSLYTRDGRRFSNDDIDFVKQLSNQAAVAIYNSQLYERTLNQAAELLKANKAKDEFLSVMSHELRTPLNIIMGYLRVLQDKMLGDLTNDQTQALGTIEKQSNELLGLINSVMEATLLQTGEVTIDPQPVSPTDIFKTLKSRIALPPEKALKVTWRCDSNLPTLVSDSAKLERILQIFIDNGIKFTEEGSVTITADYAAKQSATVFTVTDTGIGIPEESREKIFEVFRQVDNSRTREHGGLGLGLFIAKRFAHLIGAEIAVESQVGKGSMFTLTVPLGTDVSAGARVPIAVTAIG